MIKLKETKKIVDMVIVAIFWFVKYFIFHRSAHMPYLLETAN